MIDLLADFKNYNPSKYRKLCFGNFLESYGLFNRLNGAVHRSSISQNLSDVNLVAIQIIHGMFRSAQVLDKDAKIENTLLTFFQNFDLQFNQDIRDYATQHRVRTSFASYVVNNFLGDYSSYKHYNSLERLGEYPFMVVINISPFLRSKNFNNSKLRIADFSNFFDTNFTLGQDFIYTLFSENKDTVCLSFNSPHHINFIKLTAEEDYLKFMTFRDFTDKYKIYLKLQKHIDSRFLMN